MRALGGRGARAALVVLVTAGLGLTSVSCASRDAKRSTAVPPTVPKLDSSTCVDLALARSDLAAPPSPEALAKARDLMKAKAPDYLQEPIDTLAAAGGDPQKLAGDAEILADKALSTWLGQACKLA